MDSLSTYEEEKTLATESTQFPHLDIITIIIKKISSINKIEREAGKSKIRSRK